MSEDVDYGEILEALNYKADIDLKNTNISNILAPLTKVSGVPVGTILPYGGTTAPEGYLICDGSAISRTLYNDLFAILGTAYGAGDGETTFNLPNLSERFIEGNARGYITQGLPNIVGEFGLVLYWDRSEKAKCSGAFLNSQLVNDAYWASANSGAREKAYIDFKASNSNAIYGNSDTVQPATCKAYFVIKY